jgi:ribonucleoside-diphosphate reductase alpha chain
MGPQIAFCDELHGMKYRSRGETFRDAMNRVSSGMADRDSSSHYHALREILMPMRFEPAGRIQAAMGAPREVTPFNCYVSGTIPDSFVNRDNPEGSSIMHRAEQAATTMRMGGGIGYDFSTLRPRGDLIKKLQSNATGPVSFMHIYDSVCLATSSSGHRRGAQMGVLRVDHPDILEFVQAKHNRDKLTGFNISVAVTDDFMDAVAGDKKFDLTFQNEIYQTVDARELWESIMRSTWDWAEPGVLFIDTINNGNPLWYCEKIAATNPCGEQPLPPFGACLLGSFNLVRYLSSSSAGGGKTRYSFDFSQLIEDIPAVVRGMDNVIDRASYPLPEQADEARSKRRMGLGVLALANALETMGLPYGSAGFLKMQKRIDKVIMNEAYRASAMLAAERGSFPLFDYRKYSQGENFKSLDEDVRALIKKHGLRNSHLTSKAPTGTISMCADNVSSGIEPVFEVRTQRAINTPDGPQIVTLEDFAYVQFGTVPRTTSQVTAQEHVDVLLAASLWTDSAVSKTCNVTGDMPWADFKDIYRRAWEGGAKGCTTFNIDGQRMALLKKGESGEGSSCTIDPNTGARSCE